ncbi:hypothetical protein Fmac_030029 [Flemingia macrophylla]|uniref:Uncharacterized protein n=1 Tax=Flemingia macrophylla TaxID=520843 RepID=A0ABD1LC00_9FABA
MNVIILEKVKRSKCKWLTGWKHKEVIETETETETVQMGKVKEQKMKENHRQVPLASYDVSAGIPKGRLPKRKTSSRDSSPWWASALRLLDVVGTGGVLLLCCGDVIHLWPIKYETYLHNGMTSLSNSHSLSSHSSLCSMSYEKPSSPSRSTVHVAPKLTSLLQNHPLYPPTHAKLSLEFKVKILCLEVMSVDTGKALSQNPDLRTVSMESIHSIISFLVSKGLLENDLPRIFGTCPKILTSDIRTDLNPVFDFILQDLKDLVALANQDSILLVSNVENTLIPKLKFLETLGLSKDEVRSMVLRCKAVFYLDPYLDANSRFSRLIILPSMLQSNFTLDLVRRRKQLDGAGGTDTIKPVHISFKPHWVLLLLLECMLLIYFWETISGQATDSKSRNVAQSIPAKKEKDHGEKEQGKNGSNDADSYSMPSSRSLDSEKDSEELDMLKDQVEELQRKLLEKDELLKCYTAFWDLRSPFPQIKLANKQVALEKIQWEAMTSNKKVDKLQDELDSMQADISSFTLLLEGLTKTDCEIHRRL